MTTSILSRNSENDLKYYSHNCAGNSFLKVLCKDCFLNFSDINIQVATYERQQKILNLILDGFDGKLYTTRRANIGKCSQDTALVDIQNLIEKEIPVKSEPGGRSTNQDMKTNE